MAKKKTQQPRGGAEARRAASLGRLENGLRQGGDWYQWGPYLSERQWGTVREDYSADGTRGSTCRTITPGRGPTGGERTGSPASPTSSSASASGSRSGTGATRS